MDVEETFDASYQRILGTELDGRDFFGSFYEHFLGNDEQIIQRFSGTDMAVQQDMLKKSFYNLFTFFASGQVDDYIYRIAERHNRNNLDIRPEFYDTWLECLIDTVRKYDADYSDDVELAWRLVMTPGITYMKFKYDK